MRLGRASSRPRSLHSSPALSRYPARHSAAARSLPGGVTVSIRISRWRTSVVSPCRSAMGGSVHSAPVPPAALVARGLSKRYRGVTALAGVDVTVEEGELVGLLGPNGAGKSTLVKIACGLVRATAGEVGVVG